MDRIVIVGGGIVGTGLAYYLRDAPVDVRLVERDALGAGTTAASIAVFSWLQGDPDRFTHRLRERSWAEYEPRIEAGEMSFERIGALKVAESSERLAELEGAAARMREFGLDVEVLDPADLAEYNVAPEEVVGGIHLADEGYLDPTEIIRGWVRDARAAGVSVETGVEVTDVTTEDGSVTGVRTSDGDLEADAVVNAAGPWAPEVADMVDLSIPVRHTYGRILVLQLDEPCSLPYVTFEGGDYFREEGTNQVFAGRLEKSYEAATRYDPDAAHGIEPSFRRDVARRTERYVPAIADAEVRNEWVGLRAVSPDGDPLLGPTRVDGFHLATGMSGLGITLTPATMRALADHLVTGSNEVVDRLSPSRFG